MTELIQLSKIDIKAGTQVRAAINEETVCEYAEAMQDENHSFPPVILFYDGSRYVLADGFHRFLAASRNGDEDILAIVNPGTEYDALRFALSANVDHGLRRTNADKRRAVEIALKEWPKESDRQIARTCAVSHPFVMGIRAQLVTVTSCGGSQLSTVDSCNGAQLVTVTSCDEPETRVGKDGKVRKMPTKRSKPAVEVVEREDEPERPRVTAGLPEPEPEPVNTSAPSQDHQWEHAVGCEGRFFFSEQIDQIVEGCIADGSPEQIAACKLACETGARKLRLANVG